MESVANPTYPSLREFFPSALRIERAIFDLFGVKSMESDLQLCPPCIRLAVSLRTSNIDKQFRHPILKPIRRIGGYRHAKDRAVCRLSVAGPMRG